MPPDLGSPPKASLESIPAELKNIIYEKVAEDIDEASIIGRQIDMRNDNCTDPEAADRMWHALAKHLLAQTSRKLRKEFSPIHRHYALVKGLPKYYLELENYDLDRMTKLADLIIKVGPLLEHLRTNLTAEEFIIRFLLNGHAVKSVKLLGKYAQTPRRLGRGYRRLKSVFPPDRDYWSWEVVLNLYDTSMSAKQKAAATCHMQEEFVRRALGNLSDGVAIYADPAHFRRRGPGSQDLPVFRHMSPKDVQVASILGEYHIRANAGFQAAKREMHRIEVENDVREKLREELRESMKRELMTELGMSLNHVSDGLCWEKLKQEVRQEVKQEFKQEVKQKVRQEVKDEVKKELITQMHALLM